MSRRPTSMLTGEAPPSFPRRRCSPSTHQYHFADGPAGRERDNKVNLAIQICTWCDHQPACAAWAIAHDEPYGVWGGTTPRQRRSLGHIASPSHAQSEPDQQHEDTA